MNIRLIKQSQLLRYGNENRLENKIKVWLQSETVQPVRLFGDGIPLWSGDTVVGERLVELWIPAPETEQKREIVLRGDRDCHAETILLKPVRHWQVHYLQWSHHDIGYTDLPDNVLDRHCQWIEQALTALEQAENRPDDVKPRIVIEQFWSLHEYIRRADAPTRERLYKHIRNGSIEVTALYGNLITEQLGHSECYHALYETRKLAKALGITVDTAAHNDIPGVSYGLCRTLCDAGIRYFVPDFPRYYLWGDPPQTPFWDEDKLFDYEGPGAFYWEAADGKRVLFWTSRHVDTGTCDGTVDSIEEKLERLAEGGYPYDCLRIYVKGGTTDNSPYVDGFSHSAMRWNQQYAFPHITISTNTRFFSVFEKEIREKNIALPVYRGEIPGQDYPLAAMSMADVTTTARKTHAALKAAEMLLALAGKDPLLDVPREQVDGCWKNLLLADDHAYGHHFPAGPSMRASYFEKAVYAMKAEAETQDMLYKAMASIADRIQGEPGEYRLVVFNLSGYSGNLPVETPLRMLDNCGTKLIPGNRETQVLTGYILNNRRHAVLPPEMLSGEFQLIDMAAQREVACQLEETEWDSAEEYAAERAGLGTGTRRYGFFELPTGLKRMLRFTAADFPAYGYRAYRLVPTPTQTAGVQNGRWVSVHEAKSKGMRFVIENEYYKVTADDRGVVSVIDRRDGMEMLDSTCPHRLGELLVLHPLQQTETAQLQEIRVTTGKVCSTIELRLFHHHLPQIVFTIRLWAQVDTIEVSQRVLRDAAPLQTVMTAFPFVGTGICYQGTLNDLEPLRDFLPDTQSDFLAVQDWVMAKGSRILLNSMDTAIFSLGGLHTGCVSTAHCCIADQKEHPPLTEADYRRGWMYAVLSSNNFGTNFKCSQVYDLVFRYHIARVSESDGHSRALWGEMMALGVKTMLTDRSRGHREPAGTLLTVEQVHCIALERTNTEGQLLVRLWNHGDNEVVPVLKLYGKEVDFVMTDALGSVMPDKEKKIPPHAVASAIVDSVLA